MKRSAIACPLRCLLDRLPVRTRRPRRRPIARSASEPGWTLDHRRSASSRSFPHRGAPPVLQPTPQPIIGIAGEIYQTPRHRREHRPCAVQRRDERRRISRPGPGRRRRAALRGCGGALGAVPPPSSPLQGARMVAKFALTATWTSTHLQSFKEPAARQQLDSYSASKAHSLRRDLRRVVLPAVAEAKFLISDSAARPRRAEEPRCRAGRARCSDRGTCGR